MKNTNKIKILLCSPYQGAVGGISRWTGHILQYYKEQETDIELEHYYKAGKGVYQNTPILVRIYRGLSSYIPFLFGLNKILKQHSYDVVHFISSGSIALIRDILTLRITKKTQTKSLIHFRFGRIPSIVEQKGWEYKLLKRALKAADKAVVIDKASYDSLINLGYNNVTLLPNPLTPQISSLIRDHSEIKRKDRQLLFAGHVVRTKGVFELIQACATIENIKLKIAGKITEDVRSELIDKAGDGHEKWLEIVGEKDFESIIKEMMAAGIFVLPTYTEGFPNVILEAMACACPIVTTNVGAIPEMLDIENGYNHGICVEPQNVEMLKSAILKMLNNKEYALQCGINAQKRVNELYSMRSVWNEMENIWKSL